MKRLLMVSALLLSQACVYQQGDSGIRLIGLQRLQGDANSCEASEEDMLVGSYDVSGGQTYVAGTLRYESVLVDPEPLEVGDRTLPVESRDIVIEEVVFSYRVEGVTMPAEEAVPVYFVIRPNATEGSAIRRVPLVTEAARRALVAGLPVPTPRTSPAGTLYVSMQLRGHMTSGGSIASNTITFPLTVYNTGFSPEAGNCTAGGNPLPADAFTCSIRGQEGLVCP